jgi:hypothetical protein
MHNGPFGDRFVIASPEFRAEIEAAEAKAPPPSGGEAAAVEATPSADQLAHFNDSSVQGKSVRDWADNADRVERAIDAGKINEVSDKDLLRARNFVESRLAHERQKGWGPNPQPVNENLVRSLQASADFYKITERERGLRAAAVEPAPPATPKASRGLVAFKERETFDPQTGDNERIYAKQEADRQEREQEDAARAVKNQQRAASESAFKRLAEKPNGKQLTDDYLAAVERLKPNKQFLDAAAKDPAFKKSYGAIMDATTIPAKSKALRAFLAELPAHEERLTPREAPDAAVEPASVGAAAAGDTFNPQQLSRVLTEKPNPFQKTGLAVREQVSPTNIDEGSKAMAGILRQTNAQAGPEGMRDIGPMRAALLTLDRLPKEDQLKFYDRMEARDNAPAITSQQATPELQKIADMTRSVMDKDEAKLKAGGHLEDFIENYMPHKWENEPIKAPVADRGRGGPGWQKERTIPTQAEGINSGLTPKYTNPIEAAMAHHAEVKRYLATADAIQLAEKEGVFQRYNEGSALPTRPDVIIPPKFNKMAGLKDGEYLAGPASAVKLLETQVSTGLENHPAYQMLRHAGNIANQAQLLGAFHASTSLDNAFKSRLSLGIQEIAQSVAEKNMAEPRLERAARGAYHVATSVAAPVFNALERRALVKNILHGVDPSGDIQMMIMGGHHFTMDKEYSSGATLALRRALAQDKYGQVILRAAPALLEQAMKPIMEHLVPAMKTGDGVQAMRSELLRLGPDASKADIRHALGRVDDAMDDRYGQLNYNNNFWNKTAKNIGQVLLRSLGWNIGDLRAGLGGAKDLATITTRLKGGAMTDPIVTTRMAYIAAEVIGSAVVGSLYSYGKGIVGGRPLPEKQTYKDYAFPKTGGFNKDKSPERFIPAGYMKEAYGYAAQPGATIAGKVSPLGALLPQVLSGKNGIGQPFRNPNDSWLGQKGIDTAKYIAQQAVPISLRGHADNPRSQIGPFERQFGAPAPRYIANPEAINAKDAAQYKRMNSKYLGGR